MNNPSTGPVGEDGKWKRCHAADALEGVVGGEINCSKDLCVLTCNDGSDPQGPPKTKCLKDGDDFVWSKELGVCPIADEPEPTTTRPRSTTTPETMSDPTTPETTTQVTRTTIGDVDEVEDAPLPVGDDGKWQKCEILQGVSGGDINCAVDVCVLTCRDGSDPVGSPKTKCIKGKDGTFSWAKELGSCEASDEPEPTRPEPTEPEVTEADEADEGAAPGPVGDDGKWNKCEVLAGVVGGIIECREDTCFLSCDDGSEPIGSKKTKCIKNKDKTFSWAKDLGTCAACDNAGDDEEVDEDKPTEEDKPDAPAPTGEDGKWHLHTLHPSQ